MISPTIWRVVTEVGLEPTTHGLTDRCSANWATGQYLIYLSSSLDIERKNTKKENSFIINGFMIFMIISTPSLYKNHFLYFLSFFILHIYYIIFFYKNQILIGLLRFLQSIPLRISQKYWLLLPQTVNRFPQATYQHSPIESELSVVV